MKKKPKKEFGAATRARVKKEMAKPRMAKSVREGEISLGAARIAPSKRVVGEFRNFPKNSHTHTRLRCPPCGSLPTPWSFEATIKSCSKVPGRYGDGPCRLRR
jgi:hypothetical protein